MNLKELQYLIAIDEEKHFSKAAKRCFVSQPTLSGQLKKLEDELGVLLVERNNKQVKMTNVGSAVAQQARVVLAETKRIQEITQAFDDPMAGEIHLGLIPTVAPYLLPLIIPTLKKTHPQLSLWLHEHQTEVLLNMLRDAKLDLLILALPVNTNEFDEIDLYKEPFWFVVPKSDKLAHKKSIKLSDLDKREILLLQEGHCLRGQALDICFNNGANEYAGFQATSLETLRYMVAEGIGSTLLPELSIPKRILKDSAIHYLPFTNPKPNRRIGMLFRKGSYRRETYEKISTSIRSNIEKR